MKNGLTLQEESFCQLVAQGQSGVEAYSVAFSKPMLDDHKRRLYTKRASNLARRADIEVRITEAKGEQKRRDREKWQKRGDAIAENLYGAIERHFGQQGILDKDVMKGVEVLAKLKGLNAPEETVLKNGGMADDATPRGLAAISDEDLDAIIAQEKDEVIDVEVKG